MSKSIKILSALLVVIMLVSATSMVLASGELSPNSVSPSYDASTSSNITTAAGKILGWIRNIAAVISVVLIAILGIKFMIGSTEERAEYKKSFLPLIIGIFVVLSATTLASWIWGVMGA